VMNDTTHKGTDDASNPSAQRLLDAALEMIAERGYDAMSVGALSDRAGVDKSAMYWHFGSKEKLLHAVLERVVKASVEETLAGITGETPLERLDQLILGMRDRHLRPGSHLRVLLVLLLERCDVDAHARDLLRSYFENASGTIAAGIRASSALVGDDASILGDLIAAMMQGAFLRCLAVEDHAERVRLLEAVRDAALTLIRSRVAAR
jgi:AcrR family transcriptional regulator